MLKTEKGEIDANVFLVDTGATCHIVNCDSGFISVDEHFNPENDYIELADGNS